MRLTLATRAYHVWDQIPPLTRRQLTLWASLLILRRMQLTQGITHARGGGVSTPHTAHQRSFTSAALGRTLPYSILLPAAFAPSVPYPVLYLLHGAYGHHTDWPAFSHVAAHAAGLPLVIVCPEGANSCYVNGANGERWEDVIVDELPTHIEATYRTRADRQGRAIAGLSMGGFGAFNLAMRRPERYVAVSTHSGAFMMFTYASWMDGDPQFAAALGPEDSPVHQEYNPEHVIEQAVRVHGPDALPTLAMDTGTADSPVLVASNRQLHRTLTHLGINHFYREEPGGHTWDYWDREVPFTLQFVATAMSIATNV